MTAPDSNTHFGALLFDMDGVITDTHESVTAFWLKQANPYGTRITPDDFARHVYGCPAGHTLDILFPQLTVTERQAIIDEMAVYEQQLVYIPIPGVKDFLAALKSWGVPTALVTSGARWKVNAVLDQLALQEMFTAMITVEDIQRGKPHPEGYQLAARKLGKPPERCIVFEDALSGVQAAISAGTLCIGVQQSPTAAHLLAAGAHDVIPNFAAIALQANRDTPLLKLSLSAEKCLLLAAG